MTGPERPTQAAGVWSRLEPIEPPSDGIEVGRVADAWGVRGWLRIQPHSSAPEALFSCRRWVLVPPRADGLAPAYLLKVKEAREHGASVVARAEEIDERDAALALRNARVLVPRGSFPTPDADEYYWVDLIGLSVVNREGVCLGEVTDLMATGPQSVLVVQQESSGRRIECLIPFVKAYVDDVDLPARVIRVDWQRDD